MNTYSRAHLSDDSLLGQLRESFRRDRASTASLLADIGEAESRKLYLREGYSSMFDYCVEAFGLSEQSALKRLRAARKAREYPAIFAAIAEGRLNLSGVVLLAAHLTDENASELLRAAAGKRNFEIETLIAERFPRPDLPEMLRPIPQPVVPQAAALQSEPAEDLLSVRTVDPAVEPSVPAQSPALPPPRLQTPRPRVTPLAPQRFGLQTTISQGALNDLHRAQLLLSHQIPNGDIAQVLERALRLLVVQLERTKIAAAAHPRKPAMRQSANSRCIPAHVKRAVWRRDGGQCTFTSGTGHRCSAKRLLELDHITPIALGGVSSAGNLRLRCRAHNQYEAERAFGVEFMRQKRHGRSLFVPAREGRSAIGPS